MAPRKASEIHNVAPQRSSARLRLRKQPDPSNVEEEIAEPSDEPLKSEVPQSLTWRLRRKKQENLPLVTEQDHSSSDTLIEVERNNNASDLTRPLIGHRNLTEAEEKEREVFDPAWLASSPKIFHPVDLRRVRVRSKLKSIEEKICCFHSLLNHFITNSLACNRRQFRDITFVPTYDNTDKSLILEGSGRLSALSETAPDGAKRVDQGDQLPAPSGAQRPPCADTVLIANDTDFATIRQWLATTQPKWEHVSRTGYEVAQKTYRESTSQRGREDPLAPFKGIVNRTLGILAALVLFLFVMTVPPKDSDTDMNNASMSTGKAVSLDAARASQPMEEGIKIISCTEFAGREWSQTQCPLADPGNQPDSGAEKQVPSKGRTLSDDMIDSRRHLNCTVLQRLCYHKHTCSWFRNIDDPLEGDEQATSKSQWEAMKGLHEKICERLQNVPRDVATYYLEFRANTTDMYRRARYIHNVTTQFSRDQSADATEVPQVAFLHAIPVWQMRIASLNTLATPLLQTLVDVQVDLSALRYKLKSAKTRAALPRPEVVESISWPEWAAGWTDIFKSHNQPVSAHAKAIALIDIWFAETSALNHVVGEVYFELERLDKMIRDVIRTRLPVDVQFSSNSADSPDLALFLIRISQEIRSIYKLAQSSKSMQGWGKKEESEETDGSEQANAGDEA